MWHYLTNCVSADGDDINEMSDRATDVTYRTIRRVLGNALVEWAADMGYVQRNGLTLKRDWAVSYHKSVFRGEPCYFICHSMIEYIFVQRTPPEKA